MIPVCDSPAERRRFQRAFAALAVVALPLAAGAQSKVTDVPLPPPPPGTKKIDVPLPPPPPGTTKLPAGTPAPARTAAPQAGPPAPSPAPAAAKSAAAPAAAAPATAARALPVRAPGALMPSGERCSNCHAALTQRRVLHPSLEKNDCTVCHTPTQDAGKCKSKLATKWKLVKTEPDLCYGCHARKDQSKFVHTAVRQGSCLSCHAVHSSNYPGLLKEPRTQVCFDCHDLEPLLDKPVKHAPVAEGLCLDCHDPHGSDQPVHLRGASGTAFCLKCHAANAPTGKGTPGPEFRVDLSKKVVHAALKRTDCTGCHENGHGSNNLMLLKKAPVDLCYGCHQRVDRAKYPHSAVVVGDCAVCHDPHSSDQPKLLAKATVNETCFICHQDDVTGRKFVHKPVEKSCLACHDPHGTANRNDLKAGTGKEVCYSCHQQQVDTGKVKHAALERYGCTGCHDPHGTGYAYLIPKKVNELCASCHPQQKDGTHVTSLVRGGHVVGGGGLVDPRRKGHAFTCASCHNPHGSDNKDFFYYGSTAMEMCDGCHGDKSGMHPEMRNVVSEARPKTPSSQGAGGGGAGAGSGGGAPAPGGGDGQVQGGALEGRGR